jgi:hypothetical protein
LREARRGPAIIVDEEQSFVCEGRGQEANAKIRRIEARLRGTDAQNIRCRRHWRRFWRAAGGQGRRERELSRKEKSAGAYANVRSALHE